MTGRALDEWRVWHGAVLIVLTYAGTVVFHAWPWPMLVPLLTYAAMLAVWPAWRATCVWAKRGTISRSSAAAALAIGAIAVTALLIFHRHAQPDLSSLRARLILERWPHPIVWVAIFSLLNAAMEEAIFRGALFDAVAVRLGNLAAILLSSILFGMAHMEGYPPGIAGVILSGLFGLALALLRIWTAGLLLPTAVHVCADAAIAGVVLAG